FTNECGNCCHLVPGFQVTEALIFFAFEDNTNDVYKCEFHFLFLVGQITFEYFDITDESGVSIRHADPMS
ncbi:19641_t:CDS:1, partial [Funneliformis geosporum]